MIYEVLNLIQGSPEWHQTRFDKITASQVASLFSLCPYRNKTDLFNEKLNRTETEQKSKEHLFRAGHVIEQEALIKLNNGRANPFLPLVVVSKPVPDLLASLDGFCEITNKIVEVKYTGKVKLKKLHDTQEPFPHHYFQIQAQLLATGAKECLYYVTNGEDVYKEIIYPCVNIMKEIEVRVKQFADAIRMERHENK